ncbi:MAG: site-2 protease family protein, partial [Candidatus Bathyarchaeota archaeon]|nr:site-2 protease family protein [Candidatus Bathyarchaeota archaeon]
DTFMADVTPGDQLTLSTSRGNFSIKAVSHPSKPERAIVGIASSMLYYLSKIGLGAFWDTQLYTTLNWALLLLVNLAVVNMLPISLLDGDRFLQYFFQKYAKKNGWLMNLFNGVSMFLLVANMTLTLGSGLVSF